MTFAMSGMELPDRYHKDMLQLLARDAHTLFAYWEVSDRKRWLCAQHLECDWGALLKGLRLYDVSAIYFNGSNAHRQINALTPPEAGNWYFHGLQAGATYLADFGVYTPEGQFVPLLRSLPAATPVDRPAGWGAPLQPVVPEARAAGRAGRIMPHDFENFNAYANVSEMR